MKFNFKHLQQNNALIIANDWKYEEPYSFYDMTADIEDYNEFVDENLRNKNEWFEVYVDNQLVGFLGLFIENENIDIGLGLKPDYCGKGIGKDFLNNIIDFINQNYIYNTLSMDVAVFNKRAIKVYQSCGFKQRSAFIQNTNDGEYEFVHLTRNK